MANPEHLKILEQGAEVWNKWRLKNSQITPDLSKAKLDKVYLAHADLTDTNLSNASLFGAKLYGSNFSNSNLLLTNLGETSLSEAMFSNTILAGADLKDSHLSWAEFYNSDLSDAYLNNSFFLNTIFDNTKLVGTNFEGAYIFGLRIFGCDTLDLAKNIDRINHRGNSVIDHITLRSCVTGLPFSFLQGVGYTNEEIKYLKAQYSESIQYYSCFISYSSKDEDFAKDLHSKLRDANITVWFAPEDLKIGDKIRAKINEQIRIYDKLLIVLSKNSVKSSWVKYEVETALNREIKENKTILFPIRLDDSIFEINESWAIDIQSRHIGDFSNWKNHDEYKKVLKRLIKDLKAVVK